MSEIKAFNQAQTRRHFLSGFGATALAGLAAENPLTTAPHFPATAPTCTRPNFSSIAAGAR